MTYKARMHYRCTEDDKAMFERAAAKVGDNDGSAFARRVARMCAMAILAGTAATAAALNVSMLARKS